MTANTGDAKRRKRSAGGPAPATPAGSANSVRIIGGNWRSRRIRFPAAAALRPTPDRVRETLFNWLQGSLGGARCLDLYAGSGALGLEALSRGAAEVVFVERDPAVAAALAANLRLLLEPAAATAAVPAGARGRVIEADAVRFLAGTARRFDVVFLDPPYAEGRLAELCRLLDGGGWLAPCAFVYLERAARDRQPALPPSWSQWRELRAGGVSASLARRVEAT